MYMSIEVLKYTSICLYRNEYKHINICIYIYIYIYIYTERRVREILYIYIYVLGLWDRQRIG